MSTSSSSAPAFPGSRRRSTCSGAAWRSTCSKPATRAGGVIGTIHRDGALVRNRPEQRARHHAAHQRAPRRARHPRRARRGERRRRARDTSCATAGCFRCRRRPARSLPPRRSRRARSSASGASRSSRPRHPTSRNRSPRSSAAGSATEILDYAVDPFVAGIYAGDPERISVSAAFPRLHALEQKYGSLIKGQFQGARERRRAAGKAAQRGGSFSFRNGMQTLTDALARAVDRVTTGVRIGQLERDADGSWTVDGHARRRALRAAREERRACHSGVRGGQARAPARSGRGASVSSRSRMRRSRASPPSIDARTSPIRSRVSASSCRGGSSERSWAASSPAACSKAAPRPGTVLLTSFVGGVRHPELPAGSDAEIAAIVHGELQALVGARGDPAWTAITRWTHAIPQYNLGHRERLRPVEEAERALPGLFFCANYRGGVSVGDRIQSAHAMADAVKRSLGGAA